LFYVGDDFPNAHSLLEAVFALEEETNSESQTADAQGTAATAAAAAVVIFLLIAFLLFLLFRSRLEQ